MDNQELENYIRIQEIALSVLNEVRQFIHVDVTEKEIAHQCKHLFEKHGITDCWYHGVMALVLVGEHTMLSISGRDYKPSDNKVATNDLVTIDVSPELNGFWGDCARSYIVENGNVVEKSRSLELSEGITIENQLHKKMQQIASPEMTMHELYTIMNSEIDKCGYKNLDFLGNLGHSIEKEINDRCYIEQGNNKTLEEVSLFTFEPHIAKNEKKFGFKKENIYYFEGKKAKVLGSLYC